MVLILKTLRGKLKNMHSKRSKRVSESPLEKTSSSGLLLRSSGTQESQNPLGRLPRCENPENNDLSVPSGPASFGRPALSMRKFYELRTVPLSADLSRVIHNTANRNKEKQQNNLRNGLQETFHAKKQTLTINSVKQTRI